jgi:hypothetical protein
MRNSVYGLSEEFVICDNLRFSRRAIASNAQGLYGTPEKAQLASGIARPEHIRLLSRRTYFPGLTNLNDLITSS